MKNKLCDWMERYKINTVLLHIAVIAGLMALFTIPESYSGAIELAVNRWSLRTFIVTGTIYTWHWFNWGKYYEDEED